MPFCVNCGSPVSGAFCSNCGARAGAAGPPAATPPASQAPFDPGVQAFPSEAQGSFQPVQQPPQAAPQTPFQPVAPQPSPQASHQPVQHAPAPIAPAAAKGSILGKVLLVVGGVLVLLFVIVIGGAIYGAYWVKHKVSTYASAIKGDSSEDIKVVKGGNSCRLLPISDVQQILGVTIEKSEEIEEGSSPGCAYYTNQEAFSQLQKMAMEQARRQTNEVNSRPGPKPDNFPALLKETNEMEGIVKGLTMTQAVKDGRVFSFSVERGFGESSWSGMRLTEAAVPGFQEVTGVGDHAMLGAFGHAFYFMKGETMVHMDTTWVPDAKKRGSALAGKMMANL